MAHITREPVATVDSAWLRMDEPGKHRRRPCAALCARHDRHPAGRTGRGRRSRDEPAEIRREIVAHPARALDATRDLSTSAGAVGKIMTNVIGPREPLRMAGTTLKQVIFWVPCSGHLGVGVSIFSYAGDLWVAVATDAGLVPDPERIIDAFHAEISGFLELAAQVRPPGRMAGPPAASPEPRIVPPDSPVVPRESPVAPIATSELPAEPGVAPATPAAAPADRAAEALAAGVRGS